MAWIARLQAALAELMDRSRAVSKTDDSDASGAPRTQVAYFRAALNRAFANGDVPSDDGWRRAAAFENLGEARKIFLDRRQADRLIDACEGALRTS
jgi:hypothetical protein